MRLTSMPFFLEGMDSRLYLCDETACVCMCGERVVTTCQTGPNLPPQSSLALVQTVVRCSRPVSGHAVLVPGTLGTATQPRSIPRSLILLQLPYPTPNPTPTGASPGCRQQLNTSFQNLGSDGHAIYTFSTQNRMTFPGIPPRVP